MSFLTRFMPVISWGIKLLLRSGVRLTIFDPMMLTLRAKPQDGEASVTRRGSHSYLVH
jgi:hypothetical protein